MGTPHRGSSAAGYGKIIGEIANLALHVSGSYHLTGGVNTSLLRDLHPASSQLLAIAHSFLPRAKSLEIVSFYETETHPVTKRLVCYLIRDLNIFPFSAASIHVSNTSQ